MSSEPGLTAVVSERRHLLNLAYRLLGSLADAEDVVQETYVRWYALSRAQQAEIAAPAAWLTTVASRICLDQLGSARARRERYVGQWIPEPLPGRSAWVSVGSDPGDPADRITLDESVTMAFLVVLDAMTPAERVAFVLHDVFRYPFAEVGEIVGRSAAACRQLATSARRRVETATGVVTSPDAGVVRAFQRAWSAGDIEGLLAVLAPDAVATGDGGGVVHAAPEPVIGREAVARFFAERSGTPGMELAEVEVNGQPGLAARVDGATVSVLAFAIEQGRISRVWAVLNPEKLQGWVGAVAE
ncbi:RNA polymerase, sigma-24 subunit, ECF subfamily [Catenulispora acidiphila DSM 44928]|uniref:RNA polymerase, sigma-24 subunit, ECF subfamily n=1 Tax=Catenulispora acidiphila (strain DSM 44928 / JCM 14897 / NBRC 102108 / NRRL B-24433 / ID139908) TaxID=479433 RepID=C7PW03_CATAD|nr:RNA polymerase sigma factor SigJ [Catenulispora acidiphila]ACU71395.1 RNA polymerase, sigma-24 subunit, ECF subfamily [Catenulispora acidiphila DSM 44928]